MRTTNALIAATCLLLLSGPTAVRAEAADVPVVELPVEVETELSEAADLPAAAEEAPATEEEIAAPTADAAPAEPEILAAAQKVEAAAEEFGEDSPEVIEALQALARVEMEAGDAVAAESSLQRAVAATEHQYGVFSPRLASPMALLGEAYMQQGKLDDALEAYRRAQHVAHRADGVYTLDQLDYLESIARVFIEKRKYAEADRHKNFSFFVSEQNYGPDSPDLVPAMMKLGGWLQSVGKTREARRMFERAADVLEKAYGPDDPSLVEPLLALGTTTRKRGQYRKQREAALRRMVGIVNETEGVDAANKAEAWAKLGDFYTMVDDDRSAAEAYHSGWEVLQGDATLPEAEGGRYGEPRLLHFQRRIYLMENTPRATVEGYDRSLKEFPLDLEFEVTITEDGRVETVRAVDLNATSNTRRQLRRYVREARFRPAIVDGKPVRTENFRFRENVVIVRPEGS